MRHIARTCAVLWLALVAAAAAAQGRADGTAAASPPAAYKEVAVAPPKPFADKGFEKFQERLGEIAERHDREALAKLVVRKGFFWRCAGKDQADPKKAPMDNLAAALDLNGADDDAAWGAFAALAEDDTMETLPDMHGVMCSPGHPSFNDVEFKELVKSTNTNPNDWAYPRRAGVELRAGVEDGAQVIEKLGSYFLRIVSDQPPDQLDWAHVVAPSGKLGFVDYSALGYLYRAEQQLCYLKDNLGWHIAGYIDAGAP